MGKLLDRALSDQVRGLGALNLQIDAGARELLLAAADGDARRMLNLLETAADLSTPDGLGPPARYRHHARGDRQHLCAFRQGRREFL